MSAIAAEFDFTAEEKDSKLGGEIAFGENNKSNNEIKS